MPQGRSFNWLALIAVVAGLLVIGIPGMWMYMGATSTPLHPKAQDVPTVPHSAPLPTKWAAAAGQARQMLQGTLVEKNLPGLSVAVAVGGDIVWAEGFGFADLDARTPVTPNHRFRIGTASTVLTSAAAGLLLEQGSLKLDETIRTYVPAFPKKQWPVTLRHLMGHTAGLKNDGGDESSLFGEHCERPADAVPHFADGDLRFEPGAEFRYSRYGWILVSAAIEAAAAKPFLSFMQEQVLTPLGMRDTIPDPSRIDPEATPKPALERRATSYFPRFAADPTYGPDPMRDLDLSCYAGSAVFLSTPSDLVRFASAINAGKLLKRDTVQMLQTTQRLRGGSETGYGLGWDLDNVTLAGKPTVSAGHQGDALGGNVSSLITFPDKGLSVAVISNTSYADTFAIAAKIAQAFAEPAKGPEKR